MGDNREKFVLDFLVNDKELTKLNKELSKTLKTAKKDIEGVSKEFGYFFDSSDLKDYYNMLSKIESEAQDIGKMLEGASDIDISKVERFYKSLEDIEKKSDDIKNQLELVNIDTSPIDKLKRNIENIDTSSIKKIGSEIDKVESKANKKFELQFTAASLSEITENITNVLSEIDNAIGGKVRDALAFDEEGYISLENSISRVSNVLQVSTEEAEDLMNTLSTDASTTFESAADFIVQMNNAGKDFTNGGLLRDLELLSRNTDATVEDLTKLHNNMQLFTDYNDQESFNVLSFLKASKVDLKDFNEDFAEVMNLAKNAGQDTGRTISEIIKLNDQYDNTGQALSEYIKHLENIKSVQDKETELKKEGKRLTEKEKQELMESSLHTAKILKDNEQTVLNLEKRINLEKQLNKNQEETTDADKIIDAQNQMDNFKKEISKARKDVELEMAELVLSLKEQGKLDDILETVKEVFGIIGDFIKVLSDKLQSMDSEDFKDFVDAIIKVSLVAPAILALVGVLGQLGGVFMFIKGLGITGLFTTMLTNPLGQGILLIGGFITLIVILVKEWKKMKENIEKVFDALKNRQGELTFIQKIFYKIYEVVTFIVEALFEFLTGFGKISSLAKVFTGGNKSKGITHTTNNNRSIHINNYNTISSNFDSHRFNRDLTRSMIF